MSGNGSFYQVTMSGAVANEIKKCAQIAAAKGVKPQFLSALEEIYRRLRQDPRTFGETCFRSKSLKLASSIGAIRPVAVQFAVHDELPFVIVVKVSLMGEA